MSPDPSWSFLLDENVDKRLTKALKAAGWPAAHVSDDPLLRAKNDLTI
jgi:predicted nuclease of predicted toxin-antitoxin system